MSEEVYPMEDDTLPDENQPMESNSTDSEDDVRDYANAAYCEAEDKDECWD